MFAMNKPPRLYHDLGITKDLIGRRRTYVWHSTKGELIIKDVRDRRDMEESEEKIFNIKI